MSSVDQLKQFYPSEIRFSQNSISDTFCHGTFRGKKCNDVVDEIMEGRTDIGVIPRISVARWEKRFYTKNNRGLYVFRALECKGKISKITVKMIPFEEIEAAHDITMNDGGERVFVRGGGYTLPHSMQEGMAVTNPLDYGDENCYDNGRLKEESTSSSWGTGLAVGAGVLGLALAAATAASSSSRREENTQERENKKKDEECLIQ